jgi:hypothetical protein
MGHSTKWQQISIMCAREFKASRALENAQLQANIITTVDLDIEILENAPAGVPADTRRVPERVAAAFD